MKNFSIFGLLLLASHTWAGAPPSFRGKTLNEVFPGYSLVEYGNFSEHPSYMLKHIAVSKQQKLVLVKVEPYPKKEDTIIGVLDLGRLPEKVLIAISGDEHKTTFPVVCTLRGNTPTEVVSTVKMSTEGDFTALKIWQIDFNSGEFKPLPALGTNDLYCIDNAVDD